MLLQFKYGQIFREVVNFPTLDFCDAITSKTPLHLLSKVIFSLVENFSDFTNTSCPLKSIKVIDFGFDYNQLPTVFASGQYRAYLTFADEQDDKIFEATMIVEIKSSERDSWG